MRRSSLVCFSKMAFSKVRALCAASLHRIKNWARSARRGSVKRRGTKGAQLRASEFERYVTSGYDFPTLVHPTAWAARGVMIGAGTQVMAGAILQPDSEIGRNVIINSGALIEHHCRIEDHVHIAPGAILCRKVTVGTGAVVGAGAVILQGGEIAAGTLVKAASRYPI